MSKREGRVLVQVSLHRGKKTERRENMTALTERGNVADGFPLSNNSLAASAVLPRTGRERS